MTDLFDTSELIKRYREREQALLESFSSGIWAKIQDDIYENGLGGPDNLSGCFKAKRKP